jgi:hypothetical protein
MMYLRNVLLVALVFAVAALAQTPVALDTAYQVRYAANLSGGDSYFDIQNTGAQGASPLGPTSIPGINPVIGNLCVNVYAFDPNEELVSCCSCLITPDATVHLTALSDLASASLAATGVAPPSISVELIASLAGTGGSGTSCANSAALVSATSTSFPLVDGPNGMAAWGTTIHPDAAPVYLTTETPFTPSLLNTNHLNSLTGRCAFYIGNLSGHGICISCHLDALGASKM